MMKQLFYSALCGAFFLIQSINCQDQFQKAYQYTLQGDYAQAVHLYENLLQQFPHNTDILCNLGFALKKQNKMPDAIIIYEKARTIAGLSSRIERAISHAYLSIGDFERGWPAYEYRWMQPPYYNKELKDYLEKGNSLSGKKIVLKTEYGLGDSLQFIRYAQILKAHGAEKIIVESHRALIPLLSLCPYIDEIIASEGPLPASHFQALIMSMPLILKSKLSTIPAYIPYLYADSILIDHWQNKLAPDKNFKIGICWQADKHAQAENSTVKLDSQAKSITLAYLAPLSLLPNISLYSLQKINGLDQLNQIQSPCIVHNLGEFDTKNGPFMDTAAIMRNLDLIITIDTSIAHLAGGLGVPVWVLLPYHADWRWMLDRSDSPWYPTMELFRQPMQGDWESVIEKIKARLLQKSYNDKSDIQ